MTNQNHRQFVVEGRILAGRIGLLFETEPNRDVLELVLDEDPAGFVGVPVQAEGVMIEANRFLIITMRHLRTERGR